MKIFITGGAGYIGSHTVLLALEAGHEVAVYDNFCNSSPIALERIQNHLGKSLSLYENDIRDEAALTHALQESQADMVIHFAGLKAVGESVLMPLHYYDVNVSGALSLLRAMDNSDTKAIVFSSSATVYGNPQYLPYDEAHRCAPESPYGRTKHMVEEIIADWIASQNHKTGLILRYFNPVGAHETGLIGEDPLGIPNNLMPFIQQVAIGRLEKLRVFGDDYPTIDGSGVRDYLHVVDLAQAHLAAVDYAQSHQGYEIFNIGTGKGVSVFEMIKSFENVNKVNIPFEVAPRREGDIAEFYANAQKAENMLKWRAALSLDEICQSAWEFQQKNPNGYQS